MRLHPDIFHVDFMTMEQMTEKRLAKNHITFNFWGDMSIALMNGKPALARSQWKHVVETGESWELERPGNGRTAKVM